MTDGKKARVIFAFFKIGRGDSVVDNGAAGGILCPVDLQAGIISGPGVTERLETFLIHPDTGLQITGFRIPRWQQAMDLAIRLAETEPAEWGVGWDLALTDGGWVLVECNRGGAVLGPQMVQQKGMRTVVQPMLDHAARL